MRLHWVCDYRFQLEELFSFAFLETHILFFLLMFVCCLQKQHMPHRSSLFSAALNQHYAGSFILTRLVRQKLDHRAAPAIIATAMMLWCWHMLCSSLSHWHKAAKIHGISSVAQVLWSSAGWSPSLFPVTLGIYGILGPVNLQWQAI